MRLALFLIAALPLLQGCAAAFGVGANQLSDERDFRRETARRYLLPEDEVTIDRILKKTAVSTYYVATIQGNPFTCRYRVIGINCQPIR